MTNPNSIPKRDILNLESLNRKISEAEKVIADTFGIYQTNEIFLSFNGGKDCTVLLELVQSYLTKNDKFKNHKIHVIYIQSDNPFQEVEEFVDLCEKTYAITIIKKRGKLRNVLETICSESTHLKAVIMGCRRTDPYCKSLKIMQATDADWPPLMRINPLLDWTCRDIWDFILTRNIIYCTLYDIGYTSLGDRTNTKQNPHLEIVNENTLTQRYRPAYELTDDHLERSGRS